MNLQKINLRFGTELYNKNISQNNSSSVNQGIILYSPTILKKKLLEIANLYDKGKFDVENFRINYPDEFWNAIWYFQSKGIEISFMLPYVKSNKIEIVNNSNKMQRYIQFVCQEQQNQKYLDITEVNKFKNPNNKVKQIKTAIKIFNEDVLFIQHAYQLSIINIIGMVMYKSPDDYTGNISFNEKILLVKKSKDDTDEKKDIKSKKNKSNNSNIVNFDFDVSNSISTAIIENEDEYNDLMDGNINCDDYVNSNKNKNVGQDPIKIENLFEMMEKEDVNYNILADYKEVDGNDSDY
jgi:hypothetical protein